MYNSVFVHMPHCTSLGFPGAGSLCGKSFEPEHYSLVFSLCGIPEWGLAT